MWGEWAEWTDCSATCDEGDRVRVRNCASGWVKESNFDCIGYPMEIEKCFNTTCDGEGSGCQPGYQQAQRSLFFFIFDFI